MIIRPSNISLSGISNSKSKERLEKPIEAIAIATYTSFSSFLKMALSCHSFLTLLNGKFNRDYLFD